MSEYQYYEFRAVDRPLTDKEQSELRSLSSRAEISAYRFTNVYHWGNFKGSPDQMMERYFDAHVYVTNWGTRRLMLRVPLHLFDSERARPYLVDEAATLWTKGDKVILDFERNEEAPEWEEEGDEWLASLLPLRTELLSGDLRALYLGWLACASAGVLEAEKDLERLFATRRASDHEAGVRLLVDLRAVARRKGSEAEFNRRLRQLREENARRSGLIARMDQAGLSSP